MARPLRGLHHSSRSCVCCRKPSAGWVDGSAALGPVTRLTPVQHLAQRIPGDGGGLRPGAPRLQPLLPDPSQQAQIGPCISRVTCGLHSRMSVLLGGGWLVSRRTSVQFHVGSPPLSSKVVACGDCLASLPLLMKDENGLCCCPNKYMHTVGCKLLTS